MKRKKEISFVIVIVFWLFIALTAFAGTVQYTYDSLNRLTETEHDDGTVIEYTYDADGNRLTKVVTIPDSDGDGLPDALENTTCTDPNDPDTDKDGLPDGLEDTNHNGIVDLGETNPCDADTDDDGLLDGNAGSEDLNANGVVDPGETDPVNPDTDGDGIFDGTETGLTEPETEDTNISAGFFIADADPSTTTDPTDADSDDDGILDGNEDKNQDGLIDAASGETDPGNPDSDGDGILDGTETGLTEPQDPDATDQSKGFFIPDSDPSTTTDPTKADTDGDGLLDGDEDANKDGATNIDETSPASADTDGDGYSDGEEVSEGSDPNDPNSIPNNPPVANAGPDQTVEVGSGCMGTVTLNGSGSSDPDEDLLAYQWTWADEGLATGINPAVILPLGLTTVTLTVSDSEFSDSHTVDINVVDSTPHVVGITVPNSASRKLYNSL